MRLLILFVMLFTITAGNAQSPFYSGLEGSNFRGMNTKRVNLSDSLVAKKKWFVSTYSGISTSFIGWKGGYATTFSAPLVFQLNRTLNSNFTAFASVAVAPTLVNFHQRFISTDFNKSSASNSFFTKRNNFDFSSRAELGLMYTNDEHTFQISGSIGVERNSYPFPVYNSIGNNINTTNAGLIR